MSLIFENKWVMFKSITESSYIAKVLLYSQLQVKKVSKDKYDNKVLLWSTFYIHNLNFSKVIFTTKSQKSVDKSTFLIWSTFYIHQCSESPFWELELDLNTPQLLCYWTSRCVLTSYFEGLTCLFVCLFVCYCLLRLKTIITFNFEITS